MKKIIFLNTGIFCFFLVFEALMYFDKTRAITLRIGPGWYFPSCFIILGGLFYLFFGYGKRESLQTWMAEEKKFGENTFKSKKKIGWSIAYLIIFIGCTQLIAHVHLSSHTQILLITGLTGLFVTGTIVFGWLLRRDYKLMLGQAVQGRENINLKLRSIRSQLNPHFMFNALTSIQNLMNKNDIPAANHYLSMFADLTRKVLDTGDQDLISLEDELQIQEDYLQMEQLRFGFKYEVKVDEAINIANTEVPAMLLQPFVENAVKHGVGVLQQNGLIRVQVDKLGNDLQLSVTDNGKGFDKMNIQNAKSFGLKLSEQRILLLNELYKEQPVTLNIDSSPSGTRVVITLADLLS